MIACDTVEQMNAEPLEVVDADATSAAGPAASR